MTEPGPEEGGDPLTPVRLSAALQAVGHYESQQAELHRIILEGTTLINPADVDAWQTRAGEDG